MKKITIWPFIYLSYLSMFCLGFADNIRGPLFGYILKEYSLSDGTGAWFFSTSSLCSFAGSILARVLIKKIDRIQGIQISFLLFIMGNIIFGIANHFYWVLLGAVFIGLSFGLLGILQNVLVTIGADSKRQQQFITGLHAIYGLSSLLAPLMVALFIGFDNQWRLVFFATAFLSFLGLVYTFSIKKEFFELAKYKSDEEQAHKNIWSIDKVYIASVIAIYSMVELMLATRMSLYLQRTHQYSVNEASFSLSSFYVLFLLGRIIFSLKPINIPLRKQIAVMLLVSAITMALGFYKYPYLLILSGLFMAPCYPFCVGYMTEYYSKQFDEIIYVAFMLQAFFIVSMHISIGYLSDWIGLAKAVWMGPIFLLIAFLLLINFDSFYKKNNIQKL